ncbi:hypothetical protein Dimus_039696 [Dionaea muscipula]
MMFQVVKKLAFLKTKLRGLHQRHFAGLNVRLEAARSSLLLYQQRLRAQYTDDVKARVDAARTILFDLLEAEEMILKQRAKGEWFRSMDRGTAYFYALIKEKRRRLKITSLVLNDGTLAESDAAIGDEFIRYYVGLLGTDSTVAKGLDVGVVAAGPVLSTELKQQISAPFTVRDVRQALGCIHVDKTPGVDGYSSLFFIKAWDVVGEDLCEAIFDFFKTGKLLKQVNAEIIHLIAKIKNPSMASDFRPIACCSTIYKIISKMLYSRLMGVLPHLVDVSQSAFVGGRSIVNNILLCQELMVGYNRKVISPRCLAKIDLKKAYDSVHWSFVIDLMMAMGFPAIFMSWIKGCLTSVCYSININRELKGFF